MSSLLQLRFLIGLSLLAVLLLVLAGQPLQAASAPVAPGEGPQLTGTSFLLLADDDGWNIRKLWSGASGRTRVIQICVVTMCLALFILIKK